MSPAPQLDPADQVDAEDSSTCKSGFSRVQGGGFIHKSINRGMSQMVVMTFCVWIMMTIWLIPLTWVQGGGAWKGKMCSAISTEQIFSFSSPHFYIIAIPYQESKQASTGHVMWIKASDIPTEAFFHISAPELKSTNIWFMNYNRKFRMKAIKFDLNFNYMATL